MIALRTSVSSVVWLLTAGALAACTNGSHPDRSNAESQMLAYEIATSGGAVLTTGKLFSSNGATACERASSQWLPDIAYAKIDSIAYANGYAKDPNNYIVLGKVHYIVVRSSNDVRNALLTAIGSHQFTDDCKAEIEGYVRSVFDDRRKIGDSDDSQGVPAKPYLFLKTESGWVLQGDTDTAR